MNQYTYKDILQQYRLHAVENMPIAEKCVIFQHDRDSKHTTTSVQEWLKDAKIFGFGMSRSKPQSQPK